jgi:hypothetical protein
MKARMLTAEQIGFALGDLSQSLKALERITIVLQAGLLQDERDVDALHWVTQHTLQRACLVAESVALGCGASTSLMPCGADVWENLMPPLFFPDLPDAEHREGSIR